ncbi:MAG TPA: DNA topoisomerase I [archaeon]|nr:DNA topoisomerase I [archaeon]
MHIIIAEKPIAGKRIASILSNDDFETTQEKGCTFFSFKKNGEDYILIPLRGHINTADFLEEDHYWSVNGLKQLIDKKIIYKPVEKQIVSLLNTKRDGLKEIIIATDADREGEAIGVEAYNYVVEKNKNLKAKRAYFSALTEKDVNTAFSKLRDIDFNCADSVFAREEIDLLWGAILTRYLSIVSNRMGKQFLSAGRVQTPLLNFIVNRELERINFVPQKYRVIQIVFEKQKIKFEGTHKLGKIFDLEKADDIFKKIKDAKEGQVKSITKTEKILPRPPPFNTTSFLRAANALGIGTNQAMTIAENLYQEGLISYPRTDNTVYPKTIDLKEVLLKINASNEYKKYVQEILKKPLNPSKGEKETTDHPPIYPVGFSNKLSGVQEKIYDLIVRRFLATLSTSAKTENVSVTIDVNGEPFSSTGQTILELGWKEIYYYSQLNEVILPKLEKGEKVSIIDKKLEKKETTPPPHYTEGGLIKLMEEENLGTKSTRPTIIQKLKDRKYIIGTKNVSPTPIAISVCSVLNKHCDVITKPELTASLEKDMDLIAAGKKQKIEVVNENRDILQKVVDILIKEKDAISQELKGGIKEASFIGICPTCGKKLMIRHGRTGKQFVGCEGYPKCTTTYPLPQKKNIKPLNTNCEVCGAPMIEVTGARGRTFQMCLNPKCKTKEEYFAKKEQQKQIKKTKKITKKTKK